MGNSALPGDLDYRPFLQQLFGSRIIAYQVGIAKAIEEPKAALLLSQFLFYDNADGHAPGTPFARTETELYNQTGLSAKMQRTARKLLVEKGIITQEKKGMPSRHFYTINYRALISLVSGETQISLPLPPAPVLPDGKDLSNPKGTTSPARREPQVLPEGKDINTKKIKNKRSKRMANAPFAVEIVRMITHRSPAKSLWQMIERRVGERYIAWARVCRQWIAHGYNPLNYTGMLNVLDKGWQNGKSNSGSGHPLSSGYDPGEDVANFKKRKGMS